MPPEDPPQERTERVEGRLLRTADLIDLRLEAVNCTLEPTESGAELLAGDDALLIVHFPPQHVGEEVWQSMPEPPAMPARPSQHRIAGPTRLVFELPAGTRIGYTLEQILAAMPGLRLHVSPQATPAGEAGASGPRPPDDLETAIEAPYRMLISPSPLGAFSHDAAPQGAPERQQLWRTRLTVAGRAGQEDGGDEAAAARQRIVRALWTRDSDFAGEDNAGPFPMPLSRSDREAIVRQTHGGDAANADTPLEVAHLHLSSLGAWFDWKQTWEFTASIVDYRHQAFMGRDGYVRVVYPGFLFPFGHRCYLVKISEREVKHRDNPVAYLWQRWFIVLREPTRSYDDRDNPFTQVTISPLVTPDLDRPGEDGHPFVPSRNGAPFAFTLSTMDRGGEVRDWSARLVFVQAAVQDRRLGRRAVVLFPDEASPQYRPVRAIPGRGQTLAMAAPVKAGDTSVEVTHLLFDGQIDQQRVTSRPFLEQARAIVPAMRHLAPQAPAVDLAYAKNYLADGLPAHGPDGKPLPGLPNAGEIVLALRSAAPAVDFTGGSQRSGGFVAPNITVRGLSRSLGAVGASGDLPSPLDGGSFDPSSILAGALPRLFGLFSLLDLLKAAGLDEVPAFVSDALDAVGQLAAQAQRLRDELKAAQARLAQEVADAAHDGARGIAERAKNELDARTAALDGHLDALTAAVAALPAAPEDVGSAAAAVAVDLQPLLDAIGLPGVPAAVRSSLEKPTTVLKTLTEVAQDADGLADMLRGVLSGQVTARLHWRPAIAPWGLPGAPNIFAPKHEHALHVDIEVRASSQAPPEVDILAEIVDFDLNLIGDGGAGLMRLKFRRIGFRAGSAGKPEVDVVFGGIAFLGPLGFVDRLREMIPFDGFSDPPYVDVAPDGVRAGFDLALPNVSVGVFSLENIALGADARVPFLGDALTVGFSFCSKDRPFRLTVMCVGGGGWLSLRASPKGLVLLELGLEACASLSIDLGVASGSVSISVGVYLRLEGDKGLLTAYFRIRGEVDVLGLISASITLELSLTYHFDTGKLIGRASLVVEIEILFFSASVEISVERRLAGSKGDPTMRDIMPPDLDGSNADWAEYCNAFSASTP